MKRIKPSYILLFAYIVSFACNINYFLSSPKTDTIPWLHLAVSLFYIGCWVFYLQKETKNFGLMMSVFMTVISLAGYAIARWSLDVGFFIPIALLIITPFSGLMGLISVPSVWLLISAVCAVFTSIGIIQLKQK